MNKKTINGGINKHDCVLYIRIWVTCRGGSNHSLAALSVPMNADSPDRAAASVRRLQNEPTMTKSMSEKPSPSSGAHAPPSKSLRFGAQASPQARATGSIETMQRILSEACTRVEGRSDALQDVYSTVFKAFHWHSASLHSYGLDVSMSPRAQALPTLGLLVATMGAPSSWRSSREFGDAPTFAFGAQTDVHACDSACLPSGSGVCVV